MEGRYRESFPAVAGADAPKVAAEDMNAISTAVDFVGINVYLPGSYISASDAIPGFVAVPFPAKWPLTRMRHPAFPFMGRLDWKFWPPLR